MPSIVSNSEKMVISLNATKYIITHKSDAILSNHLCRESKLVKMVCSGSLALCFANNDCVTAEIIYSILHICHEVYVTGEITHTTVHVHH